MHSSQQQACQRIKYSKTNQTVRIIIICSISNNFIMKDIIFLLLLTLCFSYKIGNISKKHRFTSFSKMGQLGFTNQTGDGITQQMKTDIINIINGASGFYDDDVDDNMLYIKLVLDRLYGTDTQKFYIYIQTEPTVYGYIVSGTQDDVLIGLTDVNIFNREWSYLIIRYYGSPNLEDYVYLKYPKIGKGIADNDKAFITDTINTYETDQVNCCTLYTLDILNTLQKKYNYDLNLICDKEGVTEGLVMPYKNFWGTFKGNKCEYTIFADR